MNVSQPNLVWVQVPVVYHTDGQPSYGYGFGIESYNMGPNHVVGSYNPMKVTYAPQDVQYVS